MKGETPFDYQNVIYVAKVAILFEIKNFLEKIHFNYRHVTAIKTALLLKSANITTYK